jgi:hypothetical protein
MSGTFSAHEGGKKFDRKYEGKKPFGDLDEHGRAVLSWATRK